MSRVLVVEDQPVIREPIGAALRRDGHEVMVACNGAEALKCLDQATPDLVLLDLALPVMDGLAFLRALRSTGAGKSMPVIVLSAMSDRSRVLEAAKLGVSSYMLKSRFSLAELLAQVKKLANGSASPSGNLAGAPSNGDGHEHEAQIVRAAGAIDAGVAPADLMHDASLSTASQIEALRSLKPVMTRSQLAERIDGCGELKGFSPAVAEVLKLTGETSCSIEQVAKAISRDHAIALKVLKLANSAVYTRGEPVDSVQKAVMRIGLGQIRQTVINISVVERFGGSAVAGFIHGGQFWEHALATGIIAAELAHAVSEKDADSVFTMGLLHDVGRMVYITHLGDVYQQVLQTADQLQAPLEQVEQRMLGLNHADVMDRVFRAWKFSKHLISPIVFHHLSAGNIRTAAPREAITVALLALANRLAHAFLLGDSGNQTIYPTEEFCELLRLQPPVMARVEQIARPETDKVKFALLASSTQANWQPMRDQQRKALGVTLRPLYVSAAPESDAHRMFFDQLVDGEPGVPNIGIIHLRDLRTQASLSERFCAMEAQAGASALPLLVISPAGKLIPENAVLRGRAVSVLSTPMAVARCMAAVKSLLSPQGCAVRAAA